MVNQFSSTPRCWYLANTLFILSVTARVRSREAESGSCTAMIAYPSSSVGRNPVGTCWYHHAVAPAMATNATSTSHHTLRSCRIDQA